MFIVIAVSIYIENGQKRKVSPLAYKESYQMSKIKDVLRLGLSAALTNVNVSSMVTG